MALCDSAKIGASVVLCVKAFRDCHDPLSLAMTACCLPLKPINLGFSAHNQPAVSLSNGRRASSAVDRLFSGDGLGLVHGLGYFSPKPKIFIFTSAYSAISAVG